MMSTPGFYYGGAGLLGVLFFLMWLAGLVIGIYVLVLVIKLLRRAIEALDLYNYTKNQEIRRSQQANPLYPPYPPHPDHSEH